MAGSWRNIVANAVAGHPAVTRSWRVRLLRRLGVSIGERTRVLPGIRFIGDVRGLRIGRDCFINVELLVGSGAPVTIGDGVLVGPRTQLITTTHEIGPRERRGGPQRTAPVAIGDGTWLGAGVLVMPGVTIGAGCVIAAGAVVTRDCEPDGLYAGVPARLVRRLDGDQAGAADAVAQRTAAD